MLSSRKYALRLQWFKDRIGKKVFRNKTSCNCEVCNCVADKGIVISDEDHAQYLFEIEGCFNADGYNLKYFDTIEEVKEYEKKV